MSRPRTVCLCGSTRFAEAFNEVGKRETLNGRIVVRPEVVTYSSEVDPQLVDPEMKARLGTPPAEDRFGRRGGCRERQRLRRRVNEAGDRLRETVAQGGALLGGGGLLLRRPRGDSKAC